MRSLTLIATSLALVALPLTACGKDSGGAGSSESASLAPASSLVYVEASLEDDGDLDRLLAKFPGGAGAGGTLAGLIERGLREEDAPISYKEDVEPWLGDEVAFFVNGQLTADGDVRDAAALVATHDEDAALAAVKKAAEGKAKQASYKGHDYLALNDGGPGAAGIVDGWLVVGTLSGYEDAVDASAGDGLGDSDKYQDAIADAAEDRIGLAYVDTQAFYELAKDQPGGESLGAFGDVFDQPYVVTLDADASGAELAATLSDSDIGGVLPFLSEGTDLVADVPADSWLAFGQPELGKTVSRVVDVAANAAGGRAALERQLSAVTGGMTFEDLTGWMGDFALWVRGDSVADLSGALVIESNDEAASKRVLDKVKMFIGVAAGGAKVGPLGVPGDGFTVTDPGVPQPIHVFQRDGKVVIAYGDAAAKDALGSSDTLGDTDEFTSAVDALGGGYAVSTWVAIAPILSLVESTPAASDAEWAQIKPYLEPLGAIVSGAKRDGDKVSSAMRITVP
jgi:uncharacterized protein DUF3352